MYNNIITIEIWNAIQTCNIYIYILTYKFICTNVVNMINIKLVPIATRNNVLLHLSLIFHLTLPNNNIHLLKIFLMQLKSNCLKEKTQQVNRT